MIVGHDLQATEPARTGWRGRVGRPDQAIGHVWQVLPHGGGVRADGATVGRTVEATKTKWHPRVGVILLAVAALPLISLAALAYEELRDVREHRATVAELGDAIGQLTTALQIDSAVAEEKYWAYAIEAIDAFGVSRELVVDLVGLDPWAELEGSQEVVDRLVADAPRVTELVETARNLDAPTTVELEDAYEAVGALVRTQRDDAASRLVDMPGADDLSNAVRTLRLAADMRDDSAVLLGSFFSLRFDSNTGSAEALRQLIAADDRYRTNNEVLLRTVQPGSRSAAVLAELEADPGTDLFRREVRSAVVATITTGADHTGPLQADDVVADAPSLAENFLAAHATTETYMRLVDAAADDVNELAAAMDQDAARQGRGAMILVGVVTALGLGGTALAARAIVRPLRALSRSAESMSEGDLDVHVEESGPWELRNSARAMNEAAAQLRLAERQAIALAQGDLDDPVLELAAPGSLGASLRDAVGQLAASLNEREDYRRRLAHEAAHDPLTSLPNHTASLAHLNRGLGRAQRTGERIAVLFVDIDGFKQINDVHGHGAGDRVLVQVAQRLSEAVRQSDVVGRLGADEFLVVAEPIGDDDQVAQLAGRLLDAIERPIRHGGKVISLTATVGITTDDGRSEPDVLIREADAAVTDAKRSGGGRTRFCDDVLRAGVASRSAVEKGLSDAIANDDLVLYVQQIVDARTEQVVSLEALVRWVDPATGLIPPDRFIPVAEASDLIVALDRWVLENAVGHLARWGADHAFAEVPLAVNISGRHLSHPQLVEHVMAPLRAHGIDPRRLTIEVTETALLDDPASAASHLSALRAEGVRVAIDDFGTGYTSLAHLRALPVDTLKIDRSFVSNLERDDERTLIQMIVELGHLFGLEVVAEGVETATEARELLMFGVDALQGFHYSRPRPIADLGGPARQPSDAQPVR